jgi:glycine/D-amino acid oxidase-like deaminating enzyme
MPQSAAMAHVVVVGAGVFGAWCARHLVDGGHRVTLVEGHGPGNSRSSSGDESRIVRCGYGPDEIYTQLALRSLELWQQLAAATSGAPLFHRCGVLWLSRGDDPYTRATRRTLERSACGLEVFDPAGLRIRYPHLMAADLGEALLELDGGVVMARRSVQVVVGDLLARGVRLLRAHAAVPRSAGGGLRAVRLADGTSVEGDAFVFACGAWLPKVFPELLGDLIRPTRQVVVYIGPPAGDDRFAPSHTPAWVDFAGGIYGVPDIEHRGVKVGVDRHGPPLDPDSDDRIPDAASIAVVRQWLARHFPALADAPVVETRVCQYENTATGDFLVDRHPDHENVLLVGGGSGHGFKHGPAIGEFVARLFATGAPTHERFGLASKTTAPARSVF